jgi:hypothetical protein
MSGAFVDNRVVGGVVKVRQSDDAAIGREWQPFQIRLQSQQGACHPCNGAAAGGLFLPLRM